MEIKVSQNVSSKPCEVLVVNKFEGENTSVELANQYAVEKDHFEGKFGETYLIHTLGQIPADKVLIIGFGKKEEFYAGGNSDPRNPNILKMFGFVNVGERAGSGVDKIMTAWAEQNWKKPEFDFSERSDRVTLKLEVGQVVYIPGAADIRNENTNQEKATAVSKEDKILEYIRQNGSISSQKAADIGGYKSKTGARKLLDKMIEKGLITKIGNGPATKYVI